MDIYKLYATDEKKEVEGVEIPLGPGASITVARAENENFQRRIQEEADKHLQEIKSLPKAEADALDRKIMLEVLAETVLVGFKGLKYDGKPISYSKENAVKLLAHRDFLKIVVRHASDINNFRVVQEAVDAKNS